MGWIDEIKASWTVADAARLVGLEVRDGATPQIWPCPACGESRRGSSDRRPPVNVHQGNTAWTCKRGACGAGGDVVDLVAQRLELGRAQYGPLQVAHDSRDWTAEAVEEALDLAVYLSAELLRRRAGAV